MSELGTDQVTASVNHALWGEVTSRLRCVQFRTSGHRIDLRFFFDGAPNDDDREAIGPIGAEVAADFADAMVFEEAVGTSRGDPPARQPGWHIVYARKETSLAR